MPARIDEMDQSRLTPFQIAVMHENKVLADLLISKGAKRQLPPGLGHIKYYNLYFEQVLSNVLLYRFADT
jgi:hypothetical protein